MTAHQHLDPDGQQGRASRRQARARPRRYSGMASGDAVRPRLRVLLHHPAHPRRHCQFLGLQRLRLCCRLSRRAATPRPSRVAWNSLAARSLHDPQDLCVDGEILLHRLAHHAPHRLHGRLLSRLPHPLDDDADGAVPRLHHSVLDLERHSHDFVDPAARTTTGS